MYIVMMIEKEKKLFKNLFLRKAQVTYKSQGLVNLYECWKTEKLKNIFEVFV